jgi:hypothetical protein
MKIDVNISHYTLSNLFSVLLSFLQFLRSRCGISLVKNTMYSLWVFRRYNYCMDALLVTRYRKDKITNKKQIGVGRCVGAMVWW